MKLIEKFTVENLTVWRYKEGERELEIVKDRNILETKNCYINEKGCGCSTIWYTLNTARKEVKRLFSTGEKIKTGRDFGLCEQCQCHYSYGTKEYRKYEEFACHKQKEQYTDSV